MKTMKSECFVRGFVHAPFRLFCIAAIQKSHGDFFFLGGGGVVVVKNTVSLTLRVCQKEIIALEERYWFKPHNQ